MQRFMTIIGAVFGMLFIYPVVLIFCRLVVWFYEGRYMEASLVTLALFVLVMTGINKLERWVKA